MVKGVSINSNEIADLRLYPFPSWVYQYWGDNQKEISANLIDFKIKLPMCSREELLEELKIFKIMRPKSSQDASKLTEDTKIEIVSTKNGLYARKMNQEKYTPYYMKLKELNLRKDVIFKNILRKIVNKIF